MNSEVRQIVCAALAKGRLMRNAQKAYFTLRTQEKLTEAKAAEREFDEALDEAAYALRTGQAKPKQGVLPL
jgi:hypothetical protein